MEKELREQAIKRYGNGESPKEIYQSLGGSKTWFFKWLKRFEQDGGNWAQTRSKKPHQIANKVDFAMEQAVIQTRKLLEKEPYAQIGAYNISGCLSKVRHRRTIATINRIIRRNNLVRKRTKYQPKGVNYPTMNVTKSNDKHEFDISGPRYLKTDGRFYSANIIDAYDRRCSVNPLRRQTRIDIANTLIHCWQTLGISIYLQMDNKLPERGSNRYPHSFGLVIRRCLELGIQPIFIPIKKPWRNGIIERFQNVPLCGMFFRAQYFESSSHLLQKTKGFEAFHNQNHRYSTLEGKTPTEKFSGNATLLPSDSTLPKKPAMAPGYIHLIRFIRSNRILNVFGEKFLMPKEVEYEYVWTTIDTAKETLSVYHHSKLVVKRDYPLPKTSIDLSKIELQESPMC